MTPCAHEDAFWQVDTDSACEENGWTCAICEQRLGFRPDLDRRWAAAKAQALMLVAHEQGLIYISTGTMGADFAAEVADLCAEEEEYDQYSMLAYICLVAGGERHAEFWRNRAHRALRGETLD